MKKFLSTTILAVAAMNINAQRTSIRRREQRRFQTLRTVFLP